MQTNKSQRNVKIISEIHPQFLGSTNEIKKSDFTIKDWRIRLCKFNYIIAKNYLITKIENM